MNNIYKLYKKEMHEWISFLELNNKYSNDENKRKCILFVFLWMAYNEYCNEKYGNKGSDKEKAISLATDATDQDAKLIQDLYEELKDKFVKSFEKIEGADTPRTYIKNYYEEARFYKKNGQHKEQNEYYKSGDDLGKFLSIIYTIRCNLFHGDKPPNNTNIKIIIWAYDCLSELLDTVLKL